MRKVKFSDDMSLDEVKRDRDSSELFAVFGPIRLRLFIRGIASRRQRRVLANAIYLRILPLFGYADGKNAYSGNGWVEHLDQDWFNRFLSQDRGLSLHQAPRIQTAEEKEGYEIRMRRLNLGLSQRELAQKLGMDRAHLSRVERGRPGLRAKTRARLREALGWGESEESSPAVWDRRGRKSDEEE